MMMMSDEQAGAGLPGAQAGVRLPAARLHSENSSYNKTQDRLLHRGLNDL